MDDSSALAISQKVRSGELKAVEVVEEAISRIDKGDALFHAFLHVSSELALERAAVVDEQIARGEDPGRLAGVPVALKDNLCTKGIPTTAASVILDGWVPPYDATVVSRLKEAGAVVIGKTNMDEFAMGSSTENSAFGITRNPRDPNRVPGGSSGGSAVAVAASFVPLALGSDTGGSIRQPAALCGVVGIKPTYGLVSRYGLIAFASSLDQIGPFAATVADAVTLLEVIAGHDSRDSTSLDRPAPSILGRLDEGVNGLRVGVVSELLEGADPAVVAKVRLAADVLANAGASVEETSIPVLSYSLPAYYLLAPAEASSNLARYDGVRYGLRVDAPDVESMNSKTREKGFGPEVKRRIMLGTYALSAGYYDAFYAQAQKVRTLVINSFSAAYENYDLLLSPTSPTTAFPLGSKIADPLSMYLSDICTIPSNLAGHPAMNVPFGTDGDGLPVGVQIMAPALGEEVMARAAAVLETAEPNLLENKG